MSIGVEVVARRIELHILELDVGIRSKGAVQRTDGSRRAVRVVAADGAGIGLLISGRIPIATHHMEVALIGASTLDVDSQIVAARSHEGLRPQGFQLHLIAYGRRGAEQDFALGLNGVAHTLAHNG